MTVAFRELPAGARQQAMHTCITSELRTEVLAAWVGCAGSARYREH